MFWIAITTMLICGLAAISNFIASKKPEAAEQLEKLKEPSGWAGVILLIIGILSFFGVFTEIAWWNTFSIPNGFGILLKLSLILFAPTAIILGFMQGYALVDKYVLNKARDTGSEAGKKFDQFGDGAYEKIIKYATPVGFIGIIVAFVFLLARLGITLF